jgi:hypothetical protein
METINWGYVLSTLFIRFGGVFILLAILQIGLVSSSKIIHYIESRPLSKKREKRRAKRGKGNIQT